MITTDAQVERLLKVMNETGEVGISALKSGMSRNTATKYLKADKLPSELKGERTWRTREDPFAEDWGEIEVQLKQEPELEAKTLFDYLQERKAGKYQESQLRTFQRKVKRWRALHGPEREVFFAQAHRPGEAFQTDFTWCNELSVTIGGEPLPHMLCHVVLPYSNWESATLCYSESLLALTKGVQAAVLRLGRIAEYHQTDHSTAATHELEPGEREFNREYLGVMKHFGMKPRTIGVGKKEQNGDVESLNGGLKRRLEQQLLLRGSRDFASVESYKQFVLGVTEKRNRARSVRLAEELAVMREYRGARLPLYKEEDVKVSSWSTIRVRYNAYSVPSRLIGERVRVRIYEERLEVYLGGALQLRCERELGRFKHRIDYRHIIWSLVRKPGAFERYRYREALFPTTVFLRAYERLKDELSGRKADLEYLRILHLAASTMESEVACGLELLLEEGDTPSMEKLKVLLPEFRPDPVEVKLAPLDLGNYDRLLVSGGCAS